MKVVILGGYGFIGSHLAGVLLERGVQVRIFDKPDADPTRIEHIAGKVEIVEGDLAVEDDVARAVDDMEVVVHLACASLPASSNENITYDLESNLIGTVRMIERSLRAGVRRVVFTSSGGTVYGPVKKVPIPEDHPTEPICSYGIHKLAIEKYLALFERLHGLEWTALRPSNPYGKKQRHDSAQGAVSVFANMIKKGKTITIWGDGSVVRDYFHITDMVNACVKVIETAPPSRIYNIGAGEGVNLNQLIESFAKASGIKPKVVYEPARPLDVPENVLDISRAKSELGWEPKVSLEEGLKEYFEED